MKSSCVVEGIVYSDTSGQSRFSRGYSLKKSAIVPRTPFRPPKALRSPGKNLRGDGWFGRCNVQSFGGNSRFREELPREKDAKAEVLEGSVTSKHLPPSKKGLERM